MVDSRGHRARHPLLIGMFVGMNPHPQPPTSRWQAACRGAWGKGEVKCQAQNANSCWQAVQKTCSLRLWEPWYFAKSNEHVSQHCRATIGLFKEKIQKAGRCYITDSGDCLHAAQLTRVAFIVVVILILQSPSVCEPAATHAYTTYWFTSVRHCCAIIRLIYSWTRVMSHAVFLQRRAPEISMWLTAGALLSRTPSRSRFHLTHY